MRFKAQKSNKSIYRKFLWTFIASITVLTLLVSAVFYYSYYKSSMDILDKANMKLLSQVSYSSVYMNRLAKDMSNTLFLNNSVYASLYSSENNTIALTEAMHIMDSLNLANTYIHSIYLYNGRLDAFVSNITGEAVESKSFYDYEITQIIKNYVRNGLPELSPILRKIPSSAATEKKDLKYVYTYILPMKSSDNISIESAIIINIKVDWLRDLIKALDNSLDTTDSEIVVIDHAGIVISHPSSGMLMKKLSDKPYINKILVSMNKSGSFKGVSDNKNYVFSYISPEGSDWKFISMTPFKLVFSKINQMRTFAIVFCIIVLLIGLLLSFIASKKLYNPIYKLTNKINGVLNIDESKIVRENELDYISNAFSEIFTRADKLEGIRRNNVQFFKNEFLKNILLGNYLLEHDNTHMKIKEFDIQISFEEQVFIFLLSIDDYSSFIKKFNESDRTILKFGVSNIAKEITDKAFISEPVDMGNEQIAVLLNPGEGCISEEELYNTVKDIIIEIQKVVNQYLEIGLSAAMGYKADKANSLYTLYEDTLNILRYKFVHGKASILSPETLNNIDHNYYIIPKAKEKALIGALKLANTEEVKKTYYEIVDTLSNYSYDTIYATLIYLAYSIYYSLDTSKENGTLSFNTLVSSFIGRLSSYETLEEVNSGFEAVFGEIVEKLNTMNSKKSNVLINSIITMIQEKYYDKELCLNKIADTLNMSPIYVGRLFKDATNKSVAEYLMDIRMEKVKYYLDNSSLAIKEIVEKSGMEMSSYFYTNFRKYFGISSGSYKRSQS